MTFEDLRQEHRRLLAGSASGNPARPEEVRKFLHGAHQLLQAEARSFFRSSKGEADPQRPKNMRSLYSFVRHWSDFLFVRTRRYPEVLFDHGWEMFRSVDQEGVVSVSEVQDHQVELTFQNGGSSRVLFLAPERPKYKLVEPRLRLLEDVRERLLELRKVVLYGNPGVGKTSIAVSLAYHPQVLTHFPDGVLYASLGKGADVDTDVYNALSVWCHAFGMSDEEVGALKKVSERRAALDARMRLKRFLIIIDDVWTVDVARELTMTTDHCGYVITAYTEDVARHYLKSNVKSERRIVHVPALGTEGNLELLKLAFGGELGPREAGARKLAALPGVPALAIRLIARACATGVHPLDFEGWVAYLEGVRQHPVPVPTATAVGEDTLLRATARAIIEKLPLDIRQALQALSLLDPKPNDLTREAAEQVGGSPEAVEQLIEAGFLQPCWRSRLAIHRSIVEEVRENFTDPAGFADARKRLTTYYCGFILKHREERHFHILCADHANIISALSMAMERAGQGEDARLFVQAVHALHPYLMSKGLYDLAKDHLRRARQIAKNLGDSELEAETLMHLGEVLEKCGRYEEAAGELEAALSLNPRFQWLRYSLQERLATTLVATGDFTRADSYLLEALDAAKQAADVEACCRILLRLGVLETSRGQDKLAGEYNQRALQLAQEKRSELPRPVCSALLNEGVLAYHRGDYEQAVQLYRQALPLAREALDRELEAAILQAMGGVAIARGDDAAAQRFLDESLDAFEQLGHLWYQAIVWLERGEMHLRKGRAALATEAFYKASTIQDPATFDVMAHSLYGLGRCAAYLRDYRRAIDYGQHCLEVLEPEGKPIGHRITQQVHEWLARQKLLASLAEPAPPSRTRGEAGTVKG